MRANILAAEKKKCIHDNVVWRQRLRCRYLDYIMFNLKFSESFVIPLLFTENQLLFTENLG